MIGCYIIIWELAGKNGWTVSSAVSGVSRLTIQQPTLDDCEPTAPGCTNTLAPLDTLPYCAQSELEYAFDKYPCNYYVAPFPAPQLSGAVIAVTRTATANQTLECDVTVDATCPIVYVKSAAACRCCHCYHARPATTPPTTTTTTAHPLASPLSGTSPVRRQLKNQETTVVRKIG